MADRLEIEFRRRAALLVPDGARLAVAVSGGGDSVALLHLLVRRAKGRSALPWVLHLDHGLRADSRGDRAFVERLAAELGCPCHAERREVPRARRRDESPEEAARRVRREFLTESAARLGAEKIATGHTLDDQAETILMRLARGAGATALGGMAASGPGPWVRPLLGVERGELRRWLARHALSWRDDPTNEDLAADRNRVRLLVMPLVVRALNPRAPRHLVHAARLVAEDAALLDAMARERLDLASTARAAGSLAIDAASLDAEPPALARRMARLALARVGLDGRRVSARHVEALVALVSGARGQRVDLPAGWIARRSSREVVLERGARTKAVRVVELDACASRARS